MRVGPNLGPWPKPRSGLREHGQISTNANGERMITPKGHMFVVGRFYAQIRLSPGNTHTLHG
jgi:hypothetical protein